MHYSQTNQWGKLTVVQVKHSNGQLIKLLVLTLHISCTFANDTLRKMTPWITLLVAFIMEALQISYGLIILENSPRMLHKESDYRYLKHSHPLLLTKRHLGKQTFCIYINVNKSIFFSTYNKHITINIHMYVTAIYQ